MYRLQKQHWQFEHLKLGHICPKKGLTTDVCPSMTSNIRACFPTQETSAWLSRPSLHPCDSSCFVRRILWLVQLYDEADILVKLKFMDFVFSICDVNALIVRAFFLVLARYSPIWPEVAEGGLIFPSLKDTLDIVELVIVFLSEGSFLILSTAAMI